jgi:hypothetical protein
MSTHIPSEEMVLSEDDQRDIDKCVQQLVNRAAPGTVLQAKKKVLRFVCRDYCHMTQEELSRLQTKQELYSAAAAWVCMGCSIRCGG